MSRCKGCNLEFTADDGWQDFCSIDCARDYFTRWKKGAALIKARDDFDEWLDNPKNARLVRLNGVRAQQPTFGTFVNVSHTQEEVVGKGKNAKVVRKTVIRKENVGGKLIVRPISETDRRVARKWRGRGSFGENMKENQEWRDIPSMRGKIGQGWFPHDE